METLDIRVVSEPSLGYKSSHMSQRWNIQISTLPFSVNWTTAKEISQRLRLRRRIAVQYQDLPQIAIQYRSIPPS